MASRVGGMRDDGRLTRTTLILAISLALATAVGVGATESQAVTGAQTDLKSIKDFDAEIARYMELRRKLGTEIQSLRPNSTSVEIVNTSDALASAIQRARLRSQARVFFSPPTTVLIKRRIVETIRTEHLVSALARIDDEGPAPNAVTVYLRFPASSQMATMPPSLLAVLPLLPRELEHRIVGTALVLRDIDAALVLDYIPAAIPR